MTEQTKEWRFLLIANRKATAIYNSQAKTGRRTITYNSVYATEEGTIAESITNYEILQRTFNRF